MTLESLDPKVIKAFIDACTADAQIGSGAGAAEKFARQALTWATPPVVRPSKTLLRGTSPMCGLFFKGDLVDVTDIYFNAFEFGSEPDRNNNARRLTTTVLHEAVHWVRRRAGATANVFMGFGGEEAGDAFERLAFGQGSNVCTIGRNSEVEDALFSVRDPGRNWVR
jgi:hypothetical protein